jgi:16S rRNA (cytosine1402-N4)-methyltransferase
MHTPVLLREAVDGLDVKSNGLYIDCTYGEGGHTREILDRGGKVLAIDLDTAKIVKTVHENFKFVYGNFADLEKIAVENDFVPVDGILFDLGLSMEQISKSGRGFTFKNDSEPLDMRLDLNQDLTAEQIINSCSQNELYEIFSKNAEEISSGAISHAIVRARTLKKFKTVGDLKKILGTNENVIKRIFQALRMEVNHELDNLKAGLSHALQICKQNGRIVVITFHSVEDRIVKQFAINNKLETLTKKPIQSKSGLRFEKTARVRILINHEN